MVSQLIWHFIGFRSPLQTALNHCQGFLDEDAGFGDGFIADGLGNGYGDGSYTVSTYADPDGDSVNDHLEGDGWSSQ